MANKAAPEILGSAEFTKDMAETLTAYFDSYAQEGVVRIYVTSFGLWLENPHTRHPQFLGAARMVPHGLQ